MNTPPPTRLYKRYRFPAEIISHCVWLYFRCCLSYRDVEELRAERGVILTHDAVRNWGRKFGQGYANQVRGRRPRPGTRGTWMKSSSASTGNGTISGAPSTRMAMSSIS